MTIRPTTISRRRKNVRDSSGHEHANDGKFTGSGGGGGSGKKPENKLPTGQKQKFDQHSFDAYRDPKDGKIDMDRALQAVKSHIRDVVNAGGKAFLVTAEDGKRRELDADMRDKNGNRWGVLIVATGGGHFEVEYPPKKQGKSFRPWRKAVAESAFLDLPDVRQIHDYDCGAATTRSVARYFGVDDGRTEEDFIRELDTEPTSMIENGTAWQAIVNWFRRTGLEATPQQNMTLDDLKAHWRAGRPVIVALQDYGSLADYAKNESGHYVTVVGFVGDDVIIQDPSADNAEAGGRLPDHFPDSIQDFGKLMVRSDTFMSVWHDVDASGDVLTRFGICVGRAPAKGRKNVKDDSGHEHASDTGQFTSGGGGGGSAAKPENKLPVSGGESADAASGPPKDDPVHSYLDAFDAEATAADANTANSEIEAEGSDYRVVPDGNGGWKASHVDDLDDEFGDNWTITNDPLTGKIDIGPDDYFHERRKLRGDKISASYVEAFNDSQGEKPTEEDLAQANAEMAADGSKYQLAYSEDDGAYIAVRRKKPAKSFRPYHKAAKPANRLPV